MAGARNASPSGGYSGKPLAAKLGLKARLRIAAIAAPKDYEALLGEVPPGLTVDCLAEPAARTAAYDLVHLFVPDRAALEVQGPKALATLAQGGALWVSWPKKSSKLFRDLTEDGVRELLLPTGWVDVKVCAVDADWSGLKLLRRRPAR
jgi:hypothetical protein